MRLPITGVQCVVLLGTNVALIQHTSTTAGGYSKSIDFICSAMEFFLVLLSLLATAAVIDLLGN